MFMTMSLRSLFSRLRPVSRPSFPRVFTELCLLFAVFLVPLFFLPTTFDLLELPKQTLFSVLVLCATLSWLVESAWSRRIVLIRSWIHLTVLCVVVGVALSSVFSKDPYLSLVGVNGQMQWPLISVLAFALFYVVFAHVMREPAQRKRALFVFLLSSFLVGAVGLCQLLGLPLFGWMGDAFRDRNFSTVGTLYALAIYMTVPLIVATSMTILGTGSDSKRPGLPGIFSSFIVWGTIILSVGIAVLVDYWVVWTAILVGMALILALSYWHKRHVDYPVTLLVPGILMALSVALLLFPTPIKIVLPGEVTPSLSTSWNIARQSLEERPLLGSGPGTWIFDYAQFRPLSVNLSPFWTIRFDHARTAVVTLIATTGLIGISLWILLWLSVFVKSLLSLSSEHDEDRWQSQLLVFAGWFTSTLLLFFYTQGFAHQMTFWFFLALFVGSCEPQIVDWNAGRKGFVTGIRAASVLFFVGTVCGVWVVGQRLAAEMKYTNATVAYRAGQPIQRSIDALVRASALNPFVDVYQRNLSEAYLIRASQELGGVKNLDPERTKKVNASVALAVEAAKRATTLAPANVENWSNLGFVFQSITSFTRGADEQAIASYQEAARREPNNPAFVTEIGKIHILRSDAYRQLLQSSDASVRKDAEEKRKSELDDAAAALNQSIQIKSDYAPAHYHLGLVYERQGRLQDAIVKLEQVLKADSKNVGVAFQLGILYERVGKKDAALNVFEQIVAYDPSYANARWYLAFMYEERGRFDDAIAQVQKIAELNPGNVQVQDRLQALVKERDEKNKPPTVALPEPLPEQVSDPKTQHEVKKP